MEHKLKEGHSRLDLLINVSRLYYEYNYNQNMISEKMGLSRPYISKLIAQAREQGIVTITINDPVQTENALERQLRERFSLRKVIVVPMSVEQNPMSKVGLACARYLNTIVNNEDTIALSWGQTIYSCVQHAITREELQGISCVQACGGISAQQKNIYAEEIPKTLAKALNGVAYMLPLPAIMDDVQVKNLVLKDHSLKKVVELAREANIALFTLGGGGSDNALVQAGYLSPDYLEKIEKAGAVGDLFGSFINEQGKICDKELDARTIGLDLEELRKKDYRIAVAIGNSKVRSICGALNGGHLNVLITNEETALAVIQHLDEKE